jgi:hypothetical protein
MSAAPLIVIDDPRGLPALRARLQRDGWSVQDGWELPTDAWDVSGRRVVCAGRVDDEVLGQAALLAGSRGAGLVVIAPPEAAGDFLEDLGRLGRVERRVSAAGPGSLDAETIDLLRALAAGRSVAEAADASLMSLRTAHRRLAAARKALAVTTNRELLIEYSRRLS